MSKVHGGAPRTWAEMMVTFNPFKSWVVAYTIEHEGVYCPGASPPRELAAELVVGVRVRQMA